MSESANPKKNTPRSLWRILHEDQRGAVSLETVLIIAAVALPILIFVIKYAWPRIMDLFERGMAPLEEGVQQAQDPNF